MGRTAAARRLPVAQHFHQERARATHRALLEAAREVFVRRGFDAVQTPEIAAAAGVSTGSFYRYFVDKRAIFVEVIRAHLAETHASVMAQLTPDRFTGAEHRRAIDMALEALLGHVRRSAPIERVFLQMSLRDEEVAELRDAFQKLSQNAIAALIAQIVPREVVPDPAAAAHVVRLAAQEVALTAAGLHGPPLVAEAAARSALREMIHRYLFPGAPPSGSSTTKAVRSRPSSTKMRPPWASTARRQK
jgi:AcrR family transcriptional regulator